MHIYCVQCGAPLRDAALNAGPPICGACVKMNQRRAPLPPPEPRYCSHCGQPTEDLIHGDMCRGCWYDPSLAIR